MDLKKLGQIIRQKRVEMGISSTALARNAEIARSTLYLIERGENPRTGEPSKPSRHVLQQLTSALRLDELLRSELMEMAGYEITGVSGASEIVSHIGRPKEGDPVQQRRRSGVLASPPIRSEPSILRRNSVGETIELLISTGDLSPREEEYIASILISLTKQLMDVIRSRDGR